MLQKMGREASETIVLKYETDFWSSKLGFATVIPEEDTDIVGFRTQEDCELDDVVINHQMLRVNWSYYDKKTNSTWKFINYKPIYQDNILGIVAYPLPPVS